MSGANSKLIDASRVFLSILPPFLFFSSHGKNDIIISSHQPLENNM